MSKDKCGSGGCGGCGGKKSGIDWSPVPDIKMPPKKKDDKKPEKSN